MTILARPAAVDLNEGCKFGSLSSLYQYCRTYNRPRRKTPDRATFCDVDIWSFQTIGSGIASTIKSVITSEIANPNSMSWVWSQYASIVAELVHQFCIPVPHWKAVVKKKAKDHMQINAHMMSAHRLKNVLTKIRRYRKTMLDLITPKVKIITK